MEAKTPDACDLKSLGLDGFLYANVGTELNGSPLTVLSVLARLDTDPWEQAAGWAGLSMAAAIEGLSHGIAQMPLPPATLAEARNIAARLVPLLPAKARPVTAARDGGAKSAATRDWSPAEMMLWGVVVWTVLIVLLMSKSTIDPVPATGRKIASSGRAAASPHNHPAAAEPAVLMLR